jgi:hypothetical protein
MSQVWKSSARTRVIPGGSWPCIWADVSGVLVVSWGRDLVYAARRGGQAGGRGQGSRRVVCGTFCNSCDLVLPKRFAANILGEILLARMNDV